MRFVLGVVLPLVIMLSFVKFHPLIWNIFSLEFKRKYWAYCIVFGCLFVVLLAISVMYLILV